MPQRKAEKAYYTFSKGIVTERSPLNFEDGSALDMENFELLVDGSLKRRRGLRLEAGGAQVSLSTTAPGANDAVASTLWRNAGGDPGKTLVVLQLGRYLYFFDEDTVLSDEMTVSPIDLGFYSSTGTPADVAADPVTFAVGRSHLFVTGPKVRPLYLAYSAGTNSVAPTTIPIFIRDFVGVDDGVPWTTQPTALSASHKYNLRNRGWDQTKVDQYNTDKSKYPSKAMVWFQGYRRQIVTGFAEADGTQQWSSDKMEAELFGDSSAPQGRLFLDPFDTATGASSATATVAISSWSRSWPTATATINTAVAHGLSVGQTVYITGNQFLYNAEWAPGEPDIVTSSLDGAYVVQTVPDSDTFTITKAQPGGYVSFHSDVTLGFVGAQTLARAGGYATSARPTAVAFYAGRVFLAGAAHAELSDVVLFSQIAEGAPNYGRCYQFNDPTTENFNALLPTDGGTIKVPGLSGVKAMVPHGSSLLIFASTGVWEINGGRNGAFAANNYAVRKVSDVEAWSSSGITVTDSGVVFTSPRGIFVIVQDTNSGFLTAQPLMDNIQSLWNAIPDVRQERVMCRYDDARKRVYWLYATTPSYNIFQYDKALVLDLRLGAYFKHRFASSSSDYLTGAVALESGDNSNTNKKMKFFVLRSNRTALDICDMDQSLYTDFNSTEVLPFVTTAYDNLQDWHRHKQAPYVHVYMRKTETGYTQVGDDLVPVNESSLTMQARWDWADHSNSGKFGSAQQVYRHNRYYQPSGPSDTFDDGQPVIVTRNKVRGRGRALHLHFAGAAGKDAHLLGWLINYAAEAQG